MLKRKQRMQKGKHHKKPAGVRKRNADGSGSRRKEPPSRAGSGGDRSSSSSSSSSSSNRQPKPRVNGREAKPRTPPSACEHADARDTSGTGGGGRMPLTPNVAASRNGIRIGLAMGASKKVVCAYVL